MWSSILRPRPESGIPLKIRMLISTQIMVGFCNILEGCRQNGCIKHLVYASSSSVYGANTKLPFSESDNVDHPLSLYAASKKANELMAHSYSNLYDLPTTGLRVSSPYMVLGVVLIWRFSCLPEAYWQGKQFLFLIMAIWFVTLRMSTTLLRVWCE